MNADPLIVDTTTRMLSEICGPEVVTAAENGTWPRTLWEEFLVYYFPHTQLDIIC